jgi:hypothetical protein
MGTSQDYGLRSKQASQAKTNQAPEQRLGSIIREEEFKQAIYRRNYRNSSTILHDDDDDYDSTDMMTITTTYHRVPFSPPSHVILYMLRAPFALRAR